jgi:putative two-component system response regulator
MDAATMRQSRIVICDDEEANVTLLERMLAGAGYLNVAGTTDPARLLDVCAQSPPDLILLDLHMPGADGFEVMRRLEPFLEGTWLPILMLTADTSSEARQHALSAGARDFLTKPLDRGEVLLRIENLLEARLLHLELRDQNLRLERTVEERTRELNEARLEVLERLALTAEYCDDATGQHVQRVGRATASVCRVLGHPDEQVTLIRQAATLHDVGKIGIPDSILLKPGRLSATEHDAMKVHVEVGRRILSGSRSPVLRLGEEIAVSHHEKWNGSGYPSGLSGEQIPLSGRIVAIADAFDAMTHERPYKSRWSVEQALAEIRAESARHFDPGVVEAFMQLDHQRLLEPVEPMASAPDAGVPAQPVAVS